MSRDSDWRDPAAGAPVAPDLWGEIVSAFHRGEPALHTLRRDDGYADVDQSPALYFGETFAPPAAAALAHAHGRVLDVGCGPGRVLLHLQRQGLAVTGLDSSPLTVEVARRRGALDVRLLSVGEADFPPASFDTVVLFGNNLGLGGTLDGSRELLRRLGALTGAGGVLIGNSLDPASTEKTEHLRYHEWNRQRGRYVGQATIRYEFRGRISPWWDLVLFEPPVLEALLADCGWRPDDWIEAGSGRYFVIARKG